MTRALSLTVVLALAGCPAYAIPRFPADIAAALADEPTRRLETDHLIIYYPASRVAQARRFADHADRCAAAIRDRAMIRNQFWSAKAVIVMPELELNNAFVATPVLGLEAIAVVPTFATLDFATEFGLPPDPRFIACHELVHHVHGNQIAGLWAAISAAMGAVLSPQVGFDLWFFEGVATHYEAALQPGLGRPRWPIFTGMFAAAYAGRSIDGDDLSELKRRAPVGHHYLVGTMFVDHLVRTYGDRALWLVIAAQARSQLVVTSVASRFEAVYGRPLAELVAEFSRASARRFPVRAPPPAQRRVTTLGSDARYARGADGTEAWVTEDVDAVTTLVVRGPDGRAIAAHALAELVPPRRVAIAQPLLVSGLSVTRDGREVWLTVVDLAATGMTTRLLRWTRGAGLAEIASGLGPGATISPDGQTYYFMDVDGDRWRLARYDVAHRRRGGIVMHAAPGTYVLGAQPSPDGRRLAASVWNGARFAIWVIDLATGTREHEILGAGDAPVYDGAFLEDGRVMYLGVRADRFQVVVREPDGRDVVATDAPYAALAPRAAAGTIRFLDREGWGWDLAEVAVPAPAPPPDPDPVPAPAVATPATPPSPIAPVAPPAPVAILSDRDSGRFERLFVPTLRAPALASFGPGIPLAGIVLGGGDRLGFQRWAVAGYVQIGEAGQRTRLSGSAAYVNAMLAPWLIFADASSYRWNQREADDDPMIARVAFRARRTRDASVAIGRAWRGAWGVAASASVTDDVDQLAGTDAIRTRLGGAGLAVGYDAAVATPYTEAGRGIAASLAGTYYPVQLSTFAGDLVDVATTVQIAATVPASRLVATVEARGRAVVARAEVDADLVEVGGVFALVPLWQRASVEVPVALDDLRFPPGRRFSEPVRGFEDLPVSTDRAGIGHLALRYPLIIDRGLITTWFLPATFLRQLDVEAFGAGWVDADPDRARAWHLATGAAVTLRLALFRVPIAIQFQVARRLTDDDAWVQIVGIGPDL